MFNQRKCPCCGESSNGASVIKTNIKPREIPEDLLVEYWSGFFKEKSIFDYVRCQKCSLLFNDFYFTEEKLDLLYGSMAPNMNAVSIDSISKTQLGYFRVLQKHSSFKEGYMELGPDVGYFLKNVLSHGKNKTIVLVEPNLAVHSDLEAVCGDRPHSIMRTIEEIDSLEDSSMSEVVMIQVLDHLINPKDVLLKIQKKLVAGGVVLTVTHNEQSLMGKILGNKWPAYCMQHPQVYNPKSITKLFENSGYEVETIKRTKNYFELGFLIKHLAWLFGKKIEINQGILNKAIGLKLGNIITVARKK